MSCNTICKINFCHYLVAVHILGNYLSSNKIKTLYILFRFEHNLDFCTLLVLLIFNSRCHVLLLLQELLSQLEDNQQNISSKAISTQVLCDANKQMINVIQTELNSQMKEIQNQVQHNREEINLKNLTSKADEVSTESTTVEDNTKSPFQAIPTTKPE